MCSFSLYVAWPPAAGKLLELDYVPYIVWDGTVVGVLGPIGAAGVKHVTWSAHFQL